MEYLFIAGCARSGTTAMARLLNQDPRILIGIERYKYIPKATRPPHFYKEKFLNPAATETNMLRADLFEQFRKKWEVGRLQYIGDKVPAYYRLMPHLTQTFPYCKIIFMVRDLLPVASSFNLRAYDSASTSWPIKNDYRRAVKEWNASLDYLKQYIKAGYDKQVFIVRYEHFFSGEIAYLMALYDFLEMEIQPRILKVFERNTKDWASRSSKELTLNEEMRLYLVKHKNDRLEQWINTYIIEKSI